MATQKIVPRPLDPAKFIADLELKIANIALVKARFLIKSKTLQQAVRVLRVQNETFVGIPHYWAVYYHDGRGPVRPGADAGTGFGAQVLVWFPNPSDDPRHRGNFPIRASELRRLTREQFIQGLEENERRKKAAEGGPYQPFMIVSKLSPRSGQSVRGFFFFDDTFRGFAVEVAPLIAAEFQKFIDSYVISETDTATIKF